MKQARAPFDGRKDLEIERFTVQRIKTPRKPEVRQHIHAAPHKGGAR